MQIQFQNRKIYLDTCSLQRSQDDQTQERIRHEAEAVETIVDYFFTGQLHWIASEVLVIEITQNPDSEQRANLEDILRFVRETVLVGPIEIARREHLESLGFKRLMRCTLLALKAEARTSFLQLMTRCSDARNVSEHNSISALKILMPGSEKWRN